MNNNNNNNENKRIRFDRRVTVRKIRSHLEYTFDERSSVWYTNEEYRSFKLVIIKDTLSSQSLLTREKIHRKRIEDVRYLVLRAQEVQQKLARNGLSGNNTSGDYSEWLAQFYEHNSEPCAIAAHQRGVQVQVQNDRETIQIRREASSMLLLKDDDSSLFRNLAVMLLPADPSQC